jgi:hypothetical protein
MTGNGEKTTRPQMAVNLIGHPAQLYEFHEITEETKGVGLSQWLRPVPPRTILIAAPDMSTAIAYIEACLPDFQVQSVTPRGPILNIIKHQ